MHVVVATPLGRGGNGGIDRLMDAVADELSRSPRPPVRVDFFATRGQGSILYSPFVLLGFLVRMAAARLNGRCDVVHINLASNGSTYRKLIVAAMARTLDAAIVLHLHGGGYPSFWEKAPAWLGRAMSRMFARAEQVIVLGQVWRKFVADRVPSASIVVLPNATASPRMKRLPRGEGPVRLLFLGRISAAKGMLELLAALERLPACPGWRLTIAGDGAIEETRHEVARRGLSGQVAVIGWKDPDEVACLLSDADLLVLPSHVENLPMSIIEAMASGLAVVATRVGAVDEVVREGETGLLVPARDVTSLAEALHRLIVDEELRERLGAAGAADHRARLHIERYTDRLCEIWLQAAK